MDITPLVTSLRQDLASAAAVGGLEVEVAAERLLLALDPALRLTLMDALSQAATEIGAQLPGASVSVRLQGREPVFVVEGAPAAAAPEDHPAEPFDDEDGEATGRITLRIPESLKARAETLAARRGQSLNSWLVAAARAAASDRPYFSGESLHGFPGRRMKGWVR
ncbi:MAG TPA: toxin-antitoxin system HicB family antitoxin [Caulobacteraceae bacterium]|nr:toxin-antitoxin system HicB family antitoxin [Caulobacteraceae bacterium]